MLTQTDKAIDLAGRFGGERGWRVRPLGHPHLRDSRETTGRPSTSTTERWSSDRVSRVHEALGTEVSYSVKANPSLGVCQLMPREQEAGAEVASSGELAVARAAGFEPRISSSPVRARPTTS